MSVSSRGSSRSSRGSRASNYKPPGASWSLDKIVETLRLKLYIKTKKAQRSVQQAYVLFGRPEKGVDKACFKRKCTELGVPVNDRDIAALWQRWDNDGNGVLDFYEPVVIPQKTFLDWAPCFFHSYGLDFHSRALLCCSTTGSSST